MFGFLGKFGKGFATIAGVVLTVVGMVTGAHVGANGNGELSNAVHAITSAVPNIIAAVGVILTAFGIGRKAGAAAP